MTEPLSCPPPAAEIPRRQLITLSLGAAAAVAMGVGWLPSDAHAAPASPRPQERPMIRFRGTEFLHRWSRDSQHEFTPQADANLADWRDMITLNLHDGTAQGEQLAVVANQVLGNYQQHGKILQTRSTPRTAERPAEHLIVAVLGNPQLLEAAFARCLLHDGVGVVVVVSHRVYGQAARPGMSAWLGANGPQTEQALMAWGPLPSVAALKRLPRSA